MLLVLHRRVFVAVVASLESKEVSEKQTCCCRLYY